MSRWYRRVAILAGGLLAAAPVVIAGELPSTARPLRYALQVEPELSSLAFKGRVVVTIDVLRPTLTLTMHAADLHFGLVELSRATGNPTVMRPIIETRAREQTATLRFEAPLASGRYRLDMQYRGRIGREPSGVFALEDSSPLALRRALCTRLKPSKARTLLPLWDEPAYSAEFVVTVIVASSEAASSNGRVAARRPLEDDRAEIRFEPVLHLQPDALFLTAGAPAQLCTREGAAVPTAAQRR